MFKCLVGLWAHKFFSLPFQVVDGEEGQQDIITGIDESDASILESNGDNEDLQDYVTNILQESVNEDETISDSDEAAIITSDRDGEPKKK